MRLPQAFLSNRSSFATPVVSPVQGREVEDKRVSATVQLQLHF